MIGFFVQFYSVVSDWKANGTWSMVPTLENKFSLPIKNNKCPTANWQ